MGNPGLHHLTGRDPIAPNSPMRRNASPLARMAFARASSCSRRSPLRTRAASLGLAAAATEAASRMSRARGPLRSLRGRAGAHSSGAGGFWPGLNLRSNPRRDSGVDLPLRWDVPQGCQGLSRGFVVVEHAHGPSDRHVCVGLTEADPPSAAGLERAAGRTAAVFESRTPPEHTANTTVVSSYIYNMPAFGCDTHTFI